MHPVQRISNASRVKRFRSRTAVFALIALAAGGLAGAARAQDTNDAKFRSLFENWKKLDNVSHGVLAIPSQKPVQDFVFTSGFGVRADPFRGSAAMHPGLDMAAPIGTPIYATADGVVDRAEWVNGYGNMIEINHGKGVQTRYGHLSKILVPANSRVHRGDLIALMGSTGRSTGSHLHYEVRLDGRAVNPMPFLESAQLALAVQNGPAAPIAAGTQVAMGGPDFGAPEE